jgi:calcineurin-like phosphoesterase family protein
MIAYCGRPEDYNERLWNSLKIINDDDILIHTGDICIGKDSYVHNKLQEFKFRKILVKGNHDRKTNTWYLNNGWDFVCEEFKDTLFGKNILFSHKPRPWDGEYDINIHGHFHNSDYRRNDPELFKIVNGYHKLFALEYNDYKPIKLDKFIQYE